MNAKQRIENALFPLGIYSPECTVLKGETEAYAAAIDFVTDQCNNIRREMFTVTAEDDGLTRMEHILGLDETSVTTEERRERIISLCSLIPGEPDTKLFLNKLLELLNNRFSVNFESRNYSVRLEHDGNFHMEDLTEAADYAVKYGPAFIRFITDVPMYTWAQIEALDMTFFDIRKKGIPWGFFDETL